MREITHAIEDFIAAVVLHHGGSVFVSGVFGTAASVGSGIGVSD
jgi:hypothetical protein